MKQRLRADHTPRIFISMILALAIGIALAAYMDMWVKKLPIRQYFSRETTNAVWDWSNINNHSPQDLQETADFLYRHQVNTVFVNIDGIFRDSDNPDSEHRQLTESLERYIEVMGRRGIAVFASSGDVTWSKPENQHIPLAIQQFVFDFNSSRDTKLAGIEFDIEAYNQEHFAESSMTEKELVLNEYLDLVDKLATAQEKYTKSSGDKQLELGFAIPYWFDNQNKNIRSVSWHDKTGPVLFHLLDRLNRLPHSNVVVMAYRNASVGNDGMVYHSRTEAEYAKSNAPNVNILVGVETTDVEPEKITFYGRTFTEMSSEINLLRTEYENNKTVSGIAINDLAGLIKLSQNE